MGPICFVQPGGPAFPFRIRGNSPTCPRLFIDRHVGGDGVEVAWRRSAHLLSAQVLHPDAAGLEFRKAAGERLLIRGDEDLLKP